jgi:type IV pilus assembly protein PilM
MFSIGKKGVVGLDIGTSSVKALELKETSRGYQLVNFAVNPIQPQAVVDGAIMDANAIIESITQLFRDTKIRNRNVVMGISGHSVIVKKISLPEMSAEELEESIHWEAEQYIPFDIDDVSLDFEILETSSPTEEGKMDVILVAVKRDKIDEATSLVIQAGLTPVVVDLEAFALQNAYEINYEIEVGKNVALIDVGAGVMNINVIQEGVSVFTRDISVGGNQYTEALQKELNVSYDQAESIKKGDIVEGVDQAQVLPVIEAVSDNLAMEIQRSFDFFRATASEREIQKIVLSGGTARIRGLDEFISQRLGVPVIINNPFQNIKFSEKRFDPSYIMDIAPTAAVVVGLALRRAGDR